MRIGRSFVIALILVSIGAALAALGTGAAPRYAPGSLYFDAAALPAGEWSVGAFVVRWDTARGGSLSVTAPGFGQRVLWATIPGAPFIAASKGSEQVTENRGSFAVRDSLSASLDQQTVDSIAMRDTTLVVKGTLRGKEGSSSYEIDFSPSSDRDLAFTIGLAGKGWNRIHLTWASDRDEAFYGFGEQYSPLDMKGRYLPLLATEQGVGRGEQPITFAADLTAGSGGSWYTTYAPVPHYITNRLHSLWFENHEYSAFDLRTPDRVRFTVWASALTGHILAGDTPKSLVETYTAATGRMRALPDWIISGAVVGMQGGTARVRDIEARLEKLGTPVAAFWLQDWVGQRRTSFGSQLWWNWTLDRERYPGWEDLLAELGAKGEAVMTYVSPFLADVSERGAGSRNLFEEAKAKGYLVKDRSGAPYLIKNTSFSAGLVDLSSPEAFAWMKDVIKTELIGSGAKGWMADFGEELPWDAVLASGEPAAVWHNRYPEEWARLNREAIEEAGLGKEAVFFVRSGFTSSPRYATLFWEGDQLVDWSSEDGIKSALVGLLDSGLSGFAFNHSDIGGYTTVVNPLVTIKRSKELLLRWMELSAFTTIYRTHEGNIPSANAQFYDDEASLSQFDRCARLYAGWKDYRRKLVDEAAATGLPVDRLLLLDYPQEVAARDWYAKEFLVGDDVLVAPVLDPGRAKVQAWLPPGTWIHGWTGSAFDSPEGGRVIEVEAPIGKPAFFWKQGSEAGAELEAALRDLSK